MMRRLLFLVAFILLAMPGIVLASGYCVHEVGAKALGMAGAFVAYDDDLSALFHNPAGITQHKGYQVSLMPNLYMPSFTFETLDKSDRSELTSTALPVPYAAFAGDFGFERLRFGFTFSSPFGQDYEFSKEGPTRYNTVKAAIISYYFTPSVAYMLTNKLSIGIGVSYIMSEIQMERFETDPVMDAYSVVEGDDSSFGFNMGALFRLNQQVSLGFGYVAPVKIKYQGTATGTYQGTKLLDTDQTLELTFPQYARVGIMVSPFERWRFTSDVVWVNWSVMEEMFVDLEDNTMTQDVEIPRDWRDIWCLRIGAEHQLTNNLALRCGWFYDQGAIPDKTLDIVPPDANKFALAMGIGYTFGAMTIDLGYEHVFFHDRKITSSILEPVDEEGQSRANGYYKYSIGILGLGISYRF